MKLVRWARDRRSHQRKFQGREEEEVTVLLLDIFKSLWPNQILEKHNLRRRKKKHILQFFYGNRKVCITSSAI